MTENKKSFVLYADQRAIFEKLPDETAGKLIKHIFGYVNDENPEIKKDLLLEIAFEPIKQHLKRDLGKYNKICERNRINGLKGGRPKKPKKPTGLFGNPTEPKKPDNDNDNDNDIEKKIDKKKDDPGIASATPTPRELAKKFFKNIDDQKAISSIAASNYNLPLPAAREEVARFVGYWTELNPSGKKQRWELQKTFEVSRRLGTWFRNKRGSAAPAKVIFKL